MSDHPIIYLLRAADIAAKSQTFSHPWNPSSEITGFQLAKATGLTRTGVSLARIPPGKESFVYHSHWTEEEWIYILAGCGVARAALIFLRPGSSFERSSYSEGEQASCGTARGGVPASATGPRSDDLASRRAPA